MRHQLELFLTALGFFTRIPVPAWVPYSPERLNHSARYFPLVGWVVGGVGAGLCLAFAWVLPLSLAVVLAMAAGIRLTGAFHEDGWADTCDGLGGGWEKRQILQIMKDSRIGSYGSAGLFLMLAAKALALIELGRLAAPADSAAQVALALWAGHPLSRLISTGLLHWLPYVREDADAKAKPLARSLTRTELLIAAACGTIPLLALPALPALAGLAAAALAGLWAARLFLRRLGGYTGDCLGAVQQGSELLFYLALVATWNFT